MGISMMADPRKFQPPWRALQPDGNLGPQYGPETAETHARHCAEHANWAHRPQGARRSGYDLVREYMATDPAGVSERQREVFEAVIVGGLGTKAAAEEIGITRSSVRTYLGRLKDRALAWRKGQG